MKVLSSNRWRMLGLVLCGVLSASSVSAQVTHSMKRVQQIMPPSVSLPDCTYLILEGVAVADAAVVNDPNIALPKTHPGYKDVVALLHAAQMSGRPVTLSTTGTGTCGGYAQLNWIIINQ